jgi:Tfp pilus assembly protein PilO
MNANGRLLIGLAATVAALAAIWMTVLAPKREEAAALATSIAQAEQVRDAALASAATADRARATYDRDYGTVARLGKAVPQNADVPSLVYQLETAARRAKVDFRSVSVLDAAPEPASTTATTTLPGGGIQPAPFSFKFEGSFFGLQRLLAGINRFSRIKGTQVSVNGRLLTVDGVTLNPGRGGLPRIEGIVTARAYVADLPDVLPTSGVQPASAAGSPASPIPASEVTP